jgi:hypothetical protein
MLKMLLDLGTELYYDAFDGAERGHQDRIMEWLRIEDPGSLWRFRIEDPGSPWRFRKKGYPV